MRVMGGRPLDGGPSSRDDSTVMSRTPGLLLSLVLSLAQSPAPAAQAPAPAPPPMQAPASSPASTIPATRLQTRWAAGVERDKVLPEYPRPQMARREWMSLNGEWGYAIAPAGDGRPAAFDGRILVPFPVQSQLSGASVQVTPAQRLWYRRTFTAPAMRPGHRLLLHFGAVDWEATVFVNGRQVLTHKGGYDPFTADITDALRPGSAEQELVVAVQDPTDTGEQPRGKQVLKPHSIYYTAVTGIWQTVWLEAVPARHISALRIDPDLPGSSVHVTVAAEGGPATATVVVLDGSREVARSTGQTGAVQTIRVPTPHAWSPSDPFLYNVRVTLAGGDAVDSYFGMRSITVGSDQDGTRRLFLNGQPLFQLGLLDQGWWPGGLYTAPTDEALASDIQRSKDLGFNLIRKHVKVEPARWYYHCDRLGILVWQDMPSGDNEGAAAQAEFSTELRSMVDALRNHPSIVMWVPFNEGWGQHDTAKYVSWLQSYDPTRLVNNVSGWTDAGVGSVADLHAYPGPATPPLEKARAAVLGEFGGLGLPIESHTWLDRGNWGYRSFTSLPDLNAAYVGLLEQLRINKGAGLAAAIYTQTTDVEIEVNGVMTYDRAVVKLSPEAVAANKRMYEPAPLVTTILPASDQSPRSWRYTTTAPAATWMSPSFDAAAWSTGTGGFGARDTRHARVGTEWKTPDIWLRSSFDLRDVTFASPYLRVFHDEDAQIYLNGELAAELAGSNAGFAFVPLTGAARAALHAGRNVIAVHVKQTRGGQFIDAGIVDVKERP
jgi:hypothetical protein